MDAVVGTGRNLPGGVKGDGYSGGRGGRGWFGGVKEGG